MLTKEQGKKLLKLARKTIESCFSGKNLDYRKEKKEFSEPTKNRVFRGAKNMKDFLAKQGVFVTLMKNGELRGCIGFPYPYLPLCEAVTQASKSAAFQDFRFLPLKENELKNIKIEISVLTVPREITCDKEKIPENIKIGEDGLIVQLENNSGLLLPQVATEWNWDSKEFLESCCEKAGLSKNSWKDENCKIFKFQAQIFSE